MESRQRLRPAPSGATAFVAARPRARSSTGASAASAVAAPRRMTTIATTTASTVMASASSVSGSVSRKSEKGASLGRHVRRATVAAMAMEQEKEKENRNVHRDDAHANANPASLKPMQSQTQMQMKTPPKRRQHVGRKRDEPTTPTPGPADSPVIKQVGKKTYERISERTTNAHGQVVTTYYHKGRFLGRGGFASCYEVTCARTNAKFACKMVAKSTLVKPKARAKLKSEIKIHRSVRHANVVQFQRSFEDEDNAYIILELCDNQSLSDLLRRRKRLSEAEVRYYVRQLLEGLCYLHKKLVVHRDLKLGNLLLTKDMKIKIGDFGLAAQMENAYEHKFTVCGTPNYIAPEIITRSGNGYSFEVDIWSVGVVVYALLVGRPPFETDNVKNTYKKIRDCDYTFPTDVTISDHAKAIIRSILRVEPHCRPTIKALLSSSFFQDNPLVNSLPRSALVHTPPECKASLASNRPRADSTTVRRKLPPRYPLRSRDPNAGTQPIAEEDITPLLKSGSPSDERQRSSEPKEVIPHPSKHDLSDSKTESSDPGSPSHMEEAEPVAEPSEPQPKTAFEALRNALEPFFFLSDCEARNRKSAKVIDDGTKKRLMQIRAAYEAEQKQELQPGALWVSQWVDYSSKYGMGYILSNKSAGMYLNDRTKMILSPDCTTLEYIDRQEEDSLAPEPFTRHPVDEYDPALRKKVLLLTDFKKYLLDQRESAKEVDQFEQTVHDLVASRGVSIDSTPDRLLYLVQWVKAKNSALFGFSNHSVQLGFYDNSRILFSPDGKVVTYCDKEGRLHVHSTSAVIVNRQPMSLFKRIDYARDMVEVLIRTKSGNSTSTSQQQQTSVKVK